MIAPECREPGILAELGPRKSDSSVPQFLVYQTDLTAVPAMGIGWGLIEIDLSNASSSPQRSINGSLLSGLTVTI